MMSQVDIDKITNNNVNIYIETAHKIMGECLSKARMRGGENMYKELAEMICEQFLGSTPDDRYLRNLSDKIKKRRDPAHPDAEMIIETRNILVLATIADIGNYEVLKEKYSRSLSIPVMYTPKPWNFFNFIRVPQTGSIKQVHYKWEYTGQDNFQIAGNVIAANEYTMPGDGKPLWVEVRYEHNNKESIVYFAEYVNETSVPVTEPGSLLKLFKILATISKNDGLPFQA